MMLTLLIGLLLLVALGVMILGPHFGQWLANRMHLSRVWLWAWPYFHGMISVGFTVFAVEALYFLAPNVKQRFRATLPRAILSVLFWIGSLTCWASISEHLQTSARLTEPWEQVSLSWCGCTGRGLQC